MAYKKRRKKKKASRNKNLVGGGRELAFLLVIGEGETMAACREGYGGHSPRSEGFDLCHALIQ